MKKLRYIENSFRLSLSDMRQIVRDFHSEMEKGLAGKSSSLKMIPTYVDRPVGNEKGKFIALDLGGTNFRVLELELKGKGRCSTPKVKKFVLNKAHMTGSGRDLFGFIARCIKSFMKEMNIVSLQGLKLGFTFSFPVEQEGIASGRLLRWTKGFKVKGVLGKDVVRLLDKALAENGIRNIKVAALANDTVGTMAALAYQDKNCDVGVILGTGTNACYREDLLKVPKWKSQGTPSGYMIINTEWGNFDSLKTTKYDIELDKASANRGQQVLEKMVSGMYLGEIARLVFKDLIKNNLIFDGMSSPAFETSGNFKTEYMSRIESDVSKGLVRVSGLLNELGIKRSSSEDRECIKKICESITLRGARVSAAAIAAVVTKIDPKLTLCHTIAIDGTVYGKHPGFAKNIKAALVELFGKKTARIKLALAKDGSGKGAAIIAAVA